MKPQNVKASKIIAINLCVWKSAKYCRKFVWCHACSIKIHRRWGIFIPNDLQNEVNQLLNDHKYDLIIVFSSSAAQYVEHVTDTPKMLDFCDMDSQKWLAYVDYKKWPISAGYALEGRKLEADEKRLAKKFDLCSCATDFEVETLDGYGTGVASGYFPNGVDSDFFRPIDVDYEKKQHLFCRSDGLLPQ